MSKIHIFTRFLDKKFIIRKSWVENLSDREVDKLEKMLYGLKCLRW
jgi:hypothetical protein